MTSFVRRKLRFTFAYGTGADGDGTPTEAVVENLRCEAHVVIAGGNSLGELQVRIYGMPLSLMNQLSTLGTAVAAVRKNTITVEAGDEGGQLAQIYQGTIFSAWADLNAAPAVAFEVVAHAGLIQKMAPAPAFSAKGDRDAAAILEQLAKQMGFTFENSGVSGVIISNAYYKGTLFDQALACKEDAGIEMVVDNGVLAIWPKNGQRNVEAVLLSPATGLRGYPTYTANGLLVSSLFNPGFHFGALVKVDGTDLLLSQEDAKRAGNQLGAQVLPIGGQWKVTSLTHDLAAEYPDGPWFTEMQLTPPGLLPLSK